MYLKINRNFFQSKTFSIVIQKIQKSKKKAGQILITFKIRILRHCLTGHNQIRHHFLY